LKKILLILLLISIVNKYKSQNFELAPDEYFKNKNYLNAEIEIFNDNNILIGQYLPNDISGNFSLILERGNYKLNCIVDGKTLLKKELTVSDFDTKKENKKLKLLIEQ
tara:strand:- start:487 stop:810 length:324 start_codon:yes stop_codon:yes gene_type:complete